MNKKLFSEIRKSCETRSQRLAFNRLVKSFSDYEPLDIDRYVREYYNDPDYLYDKVEKVFYYNITHNKFDSACTEYKIFNGSEIKPFIYIENNNIVVSIGDLKGVISIYTPYNSTPGTSYGFVDGLHMELQLNKQLPEEFIHILKREGYISSYKGKRDPKFICPVKSSIESPAVRGAQIIKWAYAYFVNNDILNYFNRYK